MIWLGWGWAYFLIWLTPRQREMADLVRRRRQLIAMIVAEKNRCDTASKLIRRDIQSLVQLLERRVAKLDGRIDQAIAEDGERAENCIRLQTAPSVGPGPVSSQGLGYPSSRP